MSGGAHAMPVRLGPRVHCSGRSAEQTLYPRIALPRCSPRLIRYAIRRKTVRVKRKSISELAGDSKFIPGVYNYCDRWCERCSLSNRCLNYAMEKEADDRDPAARDLANEKFWQKLHETFRETIEMIQADAKERGIDLDDPKLQAEVRSQE